MNSKRTCLKLVGVGLLVIMGYEAIVERQVGWASLFIGGLAVLSLILGLGNFKSSLGQRTVRIATAIIMGILCFMFLIIFIGSTHDVFSLSLTVCTGGVAIGLLAQAFGWSVRRKIAGKSS